MKRFTKTAMVSVCMALLFGAGAPAEAQTVQTLTISDGKIAINGQEVSTQDLPASLDLRGLNATYTFVGDARPLIEVGGALYVLEDQRLRPVAEMRDQEGGLFLFFDEAGGEAPLLNRYRTDTDGAAISTVLAQQQAQVLLQSTEELEHLSTQVEQQPANQAIETARARVAEAAEVVQSLPKLQVQSYLSDVQQYNQNLYALLVREWRMEREAEALALEIRRTPTGDRQTDLIAQLRRKLNDIFDLKQQNRRREIQQLEQELDALTERLQKREQWRDRLVDQRLSELIGLQVSPGNR
jgi:hypothetical protein